MLVACLFAPYPSTEAYLPALASIMDTNEFDDRFLPATASVIVVALIVYAFLARKITKPEVAGQ